jgi:hypothetical protein
MAWIEVAGGRLEVFSTGEGTDMRTGEVRYHHARASWERP